VLRRIICWRILLSRRKAGGWEPGDALAGATVPESACWTQRTLAARRTPTWNGASARGAGAPPHLVGFVPREDEAVRTLRRGGNAAAAAQRMRGAAQAVHPPSRDAAACCLVRRACCLALPLLPGAACCRNHTRLSTPGLAAFRPYAVRGAKLLERLLRPPLCASAFGGVRYPSRCAGADGGVLRCVGLVAAWQLCLCMAAAISSSRRCGHTSLFSFPHKTAGMRAR